MLKAAVKFTLAVVQLIKSAISLALCIRYALDTYYHRCEKEQKEKNKDKIMFLEYKL